MAKAAPADALVGALIGNYRVESLLGAGGMGRVYRAVHPEIGRVVAIKVLALDLSGDEDLVRRFRREAQAVTKIRHPHIVDILDFGTLPDGRPFFTMELLEGESLHAYVKRAGRLSLAETVAILDPILGALEVAHAAGIVHRDLKPDNVFLRVGAAGITPTLLDFGVAKLADPAGGGDGRTAHTQTGVLLGTPAYMSPEQASGQASAIGPTSDLYSVGVMAYEMLCGVPPFAAAHLGELIHAHLVMTPAPLRQRRPDLPPELDELIAMTLAKDPAARPQSATALRRALASIAPASGPMTVLQFGGRAGTPVPAAAPLVTPVTVPGKRAQRRRRRARIAAAAAIAVGVAAAAIAAVVLSTHHDDAHPVVAAATVADAAPAPIVVRAEVADAAPLKIVAELAPPDAAPHTTKRITPPKPQRAIVPADRPPGAPVRGVDAELDAHLAKAKQAELDGDYRLALTEAEAALATRPDDEEGLFTAGHAACMGGLSARAKEFHARMSAGRYRDVLVDNCARWRGIYLTADAEQSPAAGEYRQGKLFADAQAAYSAGQYATALDKLEAMLAEKPGSALALSMAGPAACMAKDATKAAKYIALAPASLQAGFKAICKGQGIVIP